MELGQIIGDKYRIIKILGHGGTSIVYLTENIILDNLWAIKALSKSSLWFASEMQEIVMLKSLNHPMLPRIADLIEDELSYYIVMDYISGTNLLEYIRVNGKIQGKILLNWTKEILEVLSYLHGRTPPIIYRDLKPANLIVDETGRIRLIDFGTARFNREESTEDTLYIGTQGYAAPEQYGSGKSDARTDLFNLGMTLVHLATGVHPLKFDKPSLRFALKQAGLPWRFDRFILELIESDPNKRPMNCEAALKHFESILSSENAFFRGSRQPSRSELKCVIAISSILPGNGVTSFCVMLASFFSKQGFRTALAELNPSGDFERLKELLIRIDSLKKENEASFEIEGLTFFPSVSESSLIPRKGFDMVILDLGSLQNERSVRELNRSDIKLVLCPRALWKVPLISDFTERLRAYVHEEWIYAICAPLQHEVSIINRQYNLSPLVDFPLIPDPFIIPREHEKTMGNAIEQVFHHTGLKIRFKTGR